ncbi:MAG: tryptophan--tRNA ligase [Deltaproteobacteria bacterium]|nr:tryptophan--tRNA ligase [Deltaproteobacteria bacterium]
MAEKSKPLMLSGIQPTGALMIGNYVGALKNWVELQASHESFFLLADLHAITVPQDPADLQRRSLEFVALFLACGVDAERSTIFLQSHVPAHTQLSWVLNCVVPMGELQRMTQFKDKAGRSATNLHVGLFDYPVLMAADILLYCADLVPVGDDQKQHMEFTRHVARKFNGLYGEVFKIPEVFTPRTGARLMGLQTPSVKMSKSDRNEDNYIALLDRPEVVRRKIKTAVTDSGSEIRCDAAKPGISNLITLYAAVSGESAESIQNRYAGKGYAEFKRNLAELITDFLSPIQARYASIAADPAMLAGVLHRGARNADERSEATLSRVYRAVGFIPGERDQRRRVGGRRSSSERQLDTALPAASRAFHERRSIMETKETKDVTAAEAAEADAAAECMTDCCTCCCCETEEECSMEE